MESNKDLRGEISATQKNSKFKSAAEIKYKYSNKQQQHKAQAAKKFSGCHAVRKKVVNFRLCIRCAADSLPVRNVTNFTAHHCVPHNQHYK